MSTSFWLIILKTLQPQQFFLKKFFSSLLRNSILLSTYCNMKMCMTYSISKQCRNRIPNKETVRCTYRAWLAPHLQPTVATRKDYYYGPHPAGSIRGMCDHRGGAVPLLWPPLHTGNWWGNWVGIICCSRHFPVTEKSLFTCNCAKHFSQSTS